MSSTTQKQNNSIPRQPGLWDYNTAPDRIRELSGIPVSTRQLKSWVWAGRVTHAKVGTRVFFTDEHLRELIDSMTVKAVR